MNEAEIYALTDGQLNAKINSLRGGFVYRGAYSMVIADAWDLVNEIVRLEKEGWEISFDYSNLDATEKCMWRVWINRYTADENEYRNYYGEGDTAPLAIARAWLKYKLDLGGEE